MKKIANIITNHNIIILLIGLILLIPSVIGYLRTNINYNILVYLPDNLETIKGEKILTNDFQLGSFAFVMVDTNDTNQVMNLQNKIKKIDGVSNVFSIFDVIGTTLPVEMIPTDLKKHMFSDDETILVVAMQNSTSHSKTTKAIEKIRELASSPSKVSSMTGMLIDTRLTLNKEITIYIIISGILCIIILLLATNSYIMPLFLLGNIAIAVLYNMGTNIFLGQISYVTKAISAVLQLGVTTDFSIFLYHKYEKAKEIEKDNRKAMQQAILETFKSVIGSSLTTFVGFLALCTMELTLGEDIGIVMAKGVFFGLITVLTIFPSFIITFDNIIQKTKHKMIFPKFQRIQDFTLKYRKYILIILMILIIPAYIGNKNYKVYYKIDESLPKTLPFHIANKELKEKYNLISLELIILDRSIQENDINNLKEEIKSLEGVSFVLTPTSILKDGIKDLLPKNILKMLETDKYQLMILNSTYEAASKELNEQVTQINKIIKKYDKNAIVAGEGPLMTDLVLIADHDFKTVNYTSIVVIFIIMLLVFQSLALPMILIFSIEFAIFINMSIAYYMGTTLPFIASIVVGTIQLGATIDYAILLSTTYLNHRNNNIEKEEAMKKTLSTSVPSIITSALCFFAATVGVALYTKIDMIGSICMLLARGSIISMLVVVIILPALLMLFDYIILKTTRKKKEEKSMKRKLVLLIISILLINPLNTFAYNKTETIYANLKVDGSLEKTTISSQLTNIEEGDIEDNTQLQNIKNINGKEKFTRESEKLIWKSTGKDIYYQGTIEKKLPISIYVEYYLNNEKTTPKKMIGEKGKVRIKIEYINHEYHFNEGVYTPYVVDTSIILDNKNNSNINITNGKTASTGTKTIAMAITAPGLYESTGIDELKGLDKVEIEYQTTNFEAVDIYFVATPKILGELDLERLNELENLKSDIDQLQNGMNQIDEGTKSLRDGSRRIADQANQLSNSLGSITEGQKTINNNIQDLNNKVQDITTTVNAINEVIQNASNNTITITEDQYNSLPENIRQMIENITGMVSLNQNMIISIQQLNYSLEATYNLYGLGNMDEQTIRAQYIENLDEGTIELLINTKKVYETEYDENESRIAQLRARIKELLVGEEGLISTLNSYLQQVSDASNQLANGTNQITNGLEATYNGSIRLADALNQVADSTSQLSEGISRINQEGINKISELGNKTYQTVNKAKSLVNTSKDYNGFATTNANETVFVYKLSMN